MYRMKQFIEAALNEDLGRGDLYARVAPATVATGYIVAKSKGVLAGVAYAKLLAEMVPFEISWNFDDGERFEVGEKIAEFSGDSHTLLQIERTLLNMIHHASGIATLTRAYVDLIEPYDVMLLDTRKTRPLLRDFEKYASRMGGATNHRLGLDDALMLKDTHLKTIKDLKSYIVQARKNIPFTATIEIECETVDDAAFAMECGANIIMCDNMQPQSIEAVIAFRDQHYPQVSIEASGNISLETIETYAKTGVDAISTGSTIHQAVWPDFSMKIN